MTKPLLFLLLLTVGISSGQVVTTDPTFPRADQPVTITVDVSGTSLSGYAWNNDTSPVYIWTWLKKAGSSDVDAPTNVNPATALQAAAKCTRISTNPDKYQITITPTTFFNKPKNDIQQIGLKLKTKDWGDNKQTDVDKFITFSEGFDVSFSAPTQSSFFVNTNDQISITVNASESSTLTLKVGNNTVSEVVAGTTLSYNHTVTETEGTTTVTCVAVAGTQSKNISFTYTVRAASVIESRPIGIIDGINYSSDPTKVTLSLWAPGKNSVYVIGDFTDDWSILSQYQMKKDGEHFWIEISGLIAGQEYGFQYLIDETIRIADPYSDKILDPEDQFIPVTSYPSLKPYPAKAQSSDWYKNRVSVFQTNQTPYAWQKLDFIKPKKESLVIYELLIRDFFGPGNRNYQTLIDTLSYFKRLGINAIQLMPIMEFNGNESWGYNPTFMFAPDKYYGTKNKLKEFIDKCHQNGIAVIFDIAMNHQDVPNSYAVMDFNFTTFKPNPTNKWFNVNATHPFSVFNDMNHESLYTKKYLDTVNHYWINEYKIDGYRFDLSKGFTQRNNPTDVGAWSNYDDSRVAILKRMADKIWEHSPDAYVILEHLSVNQEEKELAEYRAGEGKGMMLWGKMTDQYNQNTMGYVSNSDIGQVYHGTRSWTVPHLIGYMESHDEERLMYKNLQFGNIMGTYSVKNLNTALSRMKTATMLFYTVPGPKMLWEFGEVGFDLSINRCEDGTVNNCRLAIKPPMWDYVSMPGRVDLFDFTSKAIKLKKDFTVFQTGTATFVSDNLVKQIIIKNKNYTSTPADSTLMSAVVCGNFDLVEKTSQVSFPHTGIWYDYFSGMEEEVTAATKSLSLPAGGYKLFTNFKIKSPATITGIKDEWPVQNIALYPNPVFDHIESSEPLISLHFISLNGVSVEVPQLNDRQWDAHQFAPGIYVGKGRTDRGVFHFKIIKK
jgi:1,4-alpha-glucan branching enzyme